MPRYIVGGFLAEALNLPDSEKVVLRLGGGRFQSAPGRFHPWNGTCVWDEEFSLCLEIAASDLAEATMQVEVLSLDRGWLGGEVATQLATGVLRLSWIQRTRGHFHPRMRLPLKRSKTTRAWTGPVELHLGIYVVGPGDCGPEPSWMTSVGQLRWDLLTKPSLSKKRQVRELPSSACLEFTMVALWDLVIPDWKALSVDDLLVDLHFLVEARGDVDELVLLEESMEVMQASSKWREMYPAPDSKVCLQLPRTHCLNLELPVNCDSAWLQIQVLVRKSGSLEKVLEAEATVPLQRGGWPEAVLDERNAVALSPLEDFASGRFAQVPLFAEHSRAAGMEGVDAFAIPGSVGSMKCGYRLSGRAKEKPAKAELLEDLQSTEEETEVLPEPEEEKTQRKEAAAHTHDHGYRKWETFVQEMEAKPKRSAPAYEMLPEEVEESDVEESWKDLLPSAPSVTQLAELKDVTGAHCMLHFYVHDAQLLQETQGELELEVLLGQNVAFHLSQGSGSSFQRQFRIQKELPIELPRHSRLQLRLRNSSQVLGSTLVDLQDRQLVETLREKAELAECRQLWSQQLRCVGSLQMWVCLTPLQATLELEKDLWPLPYRQDRVELRVILHEVLFSMASTAKEAVAAVELDMPVERLHRCRLPSPQYSDVRPLCLRGAKAGISFEWRCSFSLTMLRSSTQKILVISIFEPKTWQLLGTAEFLLDGVLSQVSELSGRQDLDDIPVLTRNRAGVCGSLSLTVRAVPWSLAQDFPLQAGREPFAVPSFENRDPRSVLEDLCAERLVCDPPTRSSKAIRPPICRRQIRRRQRRRWRWAALAALAAATVSALRKELMPRGRSSSNLCQRQKMGTACAVQFQ